MRRRQRRWLHGLKGVGGQVAADQGVKHPPRMSPAGRLRGRMSPAGRLRGRMSPAGRLRGRMSPAGRLRGRMSPAGRLRGSMSSGRRIGLALLLTPPLAWLVVAYLGSLAVLLVSAFWTTNAFTGAVVHTFTSDNIVRVVTDAVFRTATVRTVSVALVVTVLCVVLAVPMAFYMAKVASSRVRLALVVAVTTPLWASYLVKAYAWRVLLSPEGPMSWATGYSPGYGLTATVVTLTYLWLPYMVIPVFAAFERVPDSLVDASSDLGASDSATLRMVVAPLVFPGIAAGSIFTFSLSLGDYIAVTIVGGKTQMLSNIIYGQLVTANNQPLAAALSSIPLRPTALGGDQRLQRLALVRVPAHRLHPAMVGRRCQQRGDVEIACQFG